MKNYKILDCWLDMEDFGGVWAEIEVDGKQIGIGQQLIDDEGEIRKANPWSVSEAGCWKFVNNGAIDDGTAKITEICDNEDIAWEIFESAIDEALGVVNR